MKTEIYILGQPQPAPRPRVTRLGTYYPKSYKDWKKNTIAGLKLSKQLPCFTIGACSIEIIFVFKRIQKIKSPGRTMKTTRPDIDNLEKAVWDVLQELDVLMDDGKIWKSSAQKWYAAKNEHPHIEITIHHGDSTP